MLPLRRFQKDAVCRCLKKEKTTLKKKSPGRPRKITLGDQRIINRNIKRLRESQGTFSVYTIRAESGLEHCVL